MRTLNTEELQQVSGGFFLKGLFLGLGKSCLPSGGGSKGGYGGGSKGGGYGGGSKGGNQGGGSKSGGNGGSCRPGGSSK